MQILLVAGGEDSAERLLRYLEGAGHACEAVQGLRPAIERLGEGDVEVALLLEDLPRDSAFLVAATVQGKHRATRVVALMPEGDDDRARQLGTVGVEQLVYPPASPLDVLEAAEAFTAQVPTFTGYAVVDPGEITALEALRAHDPSCRESQWLLGFAYYRARRFTDAIPLLVSLTQEDPKHAQALYYLGSSYYRADDSARALEAWKRVLEVDPSGRLSAKAKERIERVQGRV